MANACGGVAVLGSNAGYWLMRGPGGLLISRKRDGSLRLRRLGTVVGAWILVVLLVPFLVLMGASSSYGSVSEGLGLLLTGASFGMLARRAALCPCLVLSPDGTFQEVSPLKKRLFPSSEIESVVSRSGGLWLTRNGAEGGVWAFSPSWIGHRSARSARKAVLEWMDGSGREGSRGREARAKDDAFYFGLADFLIVVLPFVTVWFVRLI
ncbi:hypothetical protein [Streptomyces sp. NPDC059874]|uniref:hypothetical protein n=1 Tax=Streptomyces sp. NPDC059874 TaxID=3346983 RepID=UPI00364A0B54